MSPPPSIAEWVLVFFFFVVFSLVVFCGLVMGGGAWL